MAKIEIYARMRPTDSQYEGLKVTQDSESGHDHIYLRTGEQERLSTPSRYSKSHPTSHNFQFKRVFECTSTQEEVFDTVSKNIINSFLDGYNGTIFAYGQTSSGKTHTIEGNGRKFADRGIIPRTLSYVYREVEGRSERGEDVSVHISYMEIYQDTGYDLLNPGMRPGALMVTLPKINISEGPGGRVVIRNLSSHLAASEEVAQSLLFQGSTCRKVAETSMNQCSSRSHSIFTISLTVKSSNSEVITRSKLNLVDLAGSERVAKTGADGRILQEAKHINLSLHHLEHVIVTLQSQLKSSASHPRVSPSPSHTGLSSRKSRDRSILSPQTPKSRESLTPSSPSLRPGTRGNYIPYRNCMLTMVLKDSLGGNCLTAMIATISVEEDNLGETISTLRFSQRVACISNRARKNEELDDKAVIKKLKQRITELETEVSSLKEPLNDQVIQQDRGVPLSGDSSMSQSLTDQDKILCHQILHGFFHGKIDNPVTAGINTSAKFFECLQVLKMVVLQALGISKQPAANHDRVSTQAKELASQVKHSHPPPPTTTPSPNSRLSSGFGSLVDTEGMATGESGHNQDVLSQQTRSPSHQQASKTPPPPVQSVSDQLREQRKRKKVERQQKQSQQSTVLSPPDSKSEGGKMRSDVPGPTISERSPRHISKAWMSPTVTPNSSIDQTRPSVYGYTAHQIPPPRKQTTPPVSPPVKVVSPREENDMQRLMLKQEELRQSRHERKKLANQVQMLDLHVEGEKLRVELGQVSEQLAQQHALVSRLQRTDTDWEQLCAEKIAEQQLRIKQAKIHQRLMDLQYCTQSSRQQSSVSAGHRVKSPPESSTLDRHHAVKSHHAPHSSKMQKELEKQELKQTQVQNQIEKLRMSQIEKQLELKEMATRRKILALKQQLLSKHTTASTQPSTDTDIRTHSQPEPAHLHTHTPSPHTPEQARNKEAHSLDVHTTSASGKQHTTTAAHTQYSRPPLSPPQTQYDQESPIRRTVYGSQTRTVTSSPQSSQSSHSNVAPTPETHAKPSHSAHPPTVQVRQTVSDDKASRKEPLARNKPSLECSKSTTKSLPLPVKLTLPEEIKETEYMTAIQRQKARVSRIRRCIVAATVIQRAWRHYRQT